MWKVVKVVLVLRFLGNEIYVIGIDGQSCAHMAAVKTRNRVN